jgi:predicted metal-dependent phosphoesterase TrpH
MDSRPRAFVDLHCHTSASFDSLADPGAVARAAARRGLTHLAITDHGTIDGALRARDAAPAGLTVLVGEEIRTTGGDLIGVFLERAVPRGLPPRDAIAAVREQGGLVGIPHPFDRRRGSLLVGQAATDGGDRVDEATQPPIASLVDWVEAWNARVFGSAGNERAATFAREHGLPGIAASDAHSTLEVGVAYTALRSDPSTPDGLRAALADPELVVGRASYGVRLITPVAKLVHAIRARASA